MDKIRWSITDGVMHLLLNRPEKRNALTEGMYRSLTEALLTAEEDVQVRALVVSGAGGAFTAGNDLDDFVDSPPRHEEAPIFCFLRKLAVFEKPIVAAVEGAAIGIGTTMLLHCDLVYAEEGSKFAFPFASLGLVPEAGSSMLLTRLCGYQRAAEKLLLGDPFNATEAREIGFVNRVMDRGQALPFAFSQAMRLATLPRGAVQGAKALMKAERDRAWTGGDEVLIHMARETKAFTARVGRPAMNEAIAAFRAKRAPDFSDLD